jgi:hypothetical protein
LGLGPHLPKLSTSSATSSAFNQDIMSIAWPAWPVEYEFVVTPYEGVLRSLANSKDFDAVMTAPATIPPPPRRR